MIENRNISIREMVKKQCHKKRIGINYILLLLILSAGLFQNSGLYAQDSTKYVTGFVRDAKTKLPIVAAQLKTLNFKASATTDSEGAFSIQIKEETDVLIINAFDYANREVAIKGRSSIIIDLYPDNFSNSYKSVNNIKRNERNSQVVNSLNDITEIKDQPFISIDKVIANSLGGDVKSVSKSGNLGIGNSMFIRGYNSLNANAQPLIVVDGVIWRNMNDVNSIHDGFFTNALADINIDDIKSVSVIKDGTSIYGSKGSNGVILIDTKRGEGLVTKIEVNASGGIIDKPELLPTMNGDNFRMYVTDLLGTVDKQQVEEIFGQTINELDFLNESASSNVYNKYHNNTNWSDEIYNYGIYQNYNVGVNGGDDKAIYGLSLGYTGVEGVVKTTDLQRFTVRFNSDVDFSETIKMGMDIAYSNIDRSILDDGVNDYSSVTYLGLIKSPFVSPYSYSRAGTRTYDFDDSDVFNVGNPSAIFEEVYNQNKHSRLNVAFSPKFKVSNEFNINAKFDYSLWREREFFYTPPVGIADVYLEGQGISKNVYKDQVIRNIALFSDIQLDYHKVINTKHTINGILGWRYNLNHFEYDYGEGHNTGVYANLSEAWSFPQYYGTNDKVKSISTYANASYNFDNRFFVNGSVSVDGSSLFGLEANGGFQMFDRSWGIFPSIQGAWLLSSEKFMSDVNFVDRLKLRGGVSISGNDDIEPYAMSAYFTSVPFLDRANGLTLSNIGNSELQWETTYKYNVGVDVNLFNDRLALSADVYSSYTKDLLIYKQLPYIVGSGFYWANEGELSNKGGELNLTVKALNLKEFNWELGASIGHYTNKIEKLPSGNIQTEIYGAELLSQVGSAAGVFYGYKTDGIYNTIAEATADNYKVVDDYGNESYFSAGDVRFLEVEDDGIIDEKDKQIIGDPNPDFYGSFSSTMNYKNLKLDAFFTFSYGNDIFNYVRASMESGSDFYNQSTAMLGRWYYEGQETDQPRVAYGDPMGNARFSDRWIEDGSYLKLKQVKLTYDFDIAGSGAIKGLSVWASANNLLTLTKYLGIDPEVSAGNSVLFQGIDRGLLPSSKSFFVGLKLNL